MSRRRAAFRAGARDVLPALPANVPFGVIAGVATISVGVDPAQAMAFAGLLFAGAAQLAAIELVGDGAPVVVVVLTALVVNARYVMYSASLATRLRELSTRWRLVVAFFLLDVTYALAVTRFEDGMPETGRWYYLGTALPLWGTWVGASAVGVAFGARVPAGWGLDFAVPLLFMGLLVPALDTRAEYVASAGACALAVVGFGLPFDAGLLVAAAGGVACGVLWEAVVER